MSLYTNLFSHGEIEITNNNGEVTFPKSKHKVYKIDDCHIVQELNKVDTGKSMKELRETFKGTLPTYIKNRAEAITEDVPMMSYEMYLKELKDALIFNGDIQRGNLSRLWIDANEGVTVGNILILNKYPGKYTIISELHKAGKLVSVHEADLEELLEQMED